MLTGIRHVAWDWNGTLFNDVDAALVSINTMLASRGMPVLDKKRYREIFGFPVIDCYRVLGFEFSTESEWDAIANEFHANYNRIAENSRLSDGVEALLETLAGKGIAMSVLSAAVTSTLEKSLKYFAIDHYFAHVFGHNDLYGSAKIGLGRRLLETLDIAPESLLIIGDTVHDFEVAEDLGCRCALYLDGHQDQARLEQCGCPVISDLLSLL